MKKLLVVAMIGLSLGVLPTPSTKGPVGVTAAHAQSIQRGINVFVVLFGTGSGM
jgi:hypothetical protein